jgi:cobalt-zinc-cadmium efflux system outer membrane protein
MLHPTRSARGKLSAVIRPITLCSTLFIIQVCYTYSGAQGLSADEFVSRALAANAELAAARLNVERAGARLRQAGLRPNPSISFERQDGAFDSPGEGGTFIGLSLPVEIGGKRRGRIDLARIELEAAEAEIADRERRLANDVRIAYAEAMAALDELEITSGLDNLDTQTARVVEARVREGDAAPLELNLLRVEIERLRSRRALIAGRLQAALLRLQNLAALDRPLRPSESLSAAPSFQPPATVESAIGIALRNRPDLRLARLEEEAAMAGLKLARAQSAPDVTLFTRYGSQISTFDSTPVGPISDRDRLLAFGVSISLPVFNRNQGAKAEAEITIAQAKQRRRFIESSALADVKSAWARYEAAGAALETFEQGVLARSSDNIRAIRGAYEVGGLRITDLINEQRRLLDARREFAEALGERYRALADLQAAIGVDQKH